MACRADFVTADAANGCHNGWDIQDSFLKMASIVVLAIPVWSLALNMPWNTCDFIATLWQAAWSTSDATDGV